MRRSTMIAGGAVVGIAGVIALPRPSTPQQVAVAGNAAATGSARGAGPTAAAATTTKNTPARTTSTPAASAKRAASTVTGSLVADQYGQLQVKLSVKNGRISKVGFTTFVANDGHSVQIDQSAAPVLIRETIAAQSAHIQGVSGATYTSNAYQQSLQAAIDKAGLKA